MFRSLPLAFASFHTNVRSQSALRIPQGPSSPRNRRNPLSTIQKWPNALHDRTQSEGSTNVFGDQEEFSTPENSLPTNSTALYQPLAPYSPPADAILLLNLVAIIWGSQHTVIKMCIADVDPSSFSLVRFLLAALIATPSWWYSSSSTQNHDNLKKDNNIKISTSGNHWFITWRWGIEMGLWMFLGYAFQSIGLKYTTALRSGFLLYLNVKLVPFFAFLLVGRKISIPTWVSAFTALAGTSLLAYDGGSLTLNVGDWWSIAAAAASAMFILRLESATAAVQNSSALNASCLWVVAGASTIWSVSLGSFSMESVYATISSHPLELFYLSAVTTALANWIQAKAQQKVTAERASVIYAMDPVWGALWANLLLGETLSGLGIVGASLITIAAATNAFLDLGASSKS